MKKSIAILLALVLMMTVVFFGCGKKEEAEEANGDTTSQQLPAEGSSDANAPLENGDTSADTTDTSASTDVTNATGTSDATGTTDANGTTDVTGTTDANNTTDVTGATDTTEATTPSKPDFSTSEPDNSQQTVVPQNNTKLEKYRQMFASGCYSMTIVTIENGVEDIPIEFACKNGNVRMSMEMDEFPAIMLYKADNDTAYLLIEFIGKFYTELTEEIMGEEVDFTELTEGFDIPADAVITEGTGTFEGKTFATETIKTENKTSVFYFDNSGTLIATEITDKDGDVSITKLNNISTSIDDSLFEIPKEYTYMDLSWLMSMA